jgi:hypothetical protein
MFMCSSYFCEVSLYPQDFVKFVTDQPSSFNYVEPILDMLCASDKDCICFIWVFPFYGKLELCFCCVLLRYIYSHDNLDIFSPITPLISLTLFIS